MALPTGTVTFLFTDIEGSTRLLDELGDRYAEVLAEHHRLMRQSFEPHGGAEVDTAGDAFFVAFGRASDAVAAAAAAQEALAPSGLQVRMGIHTGEPLLTETGYVGMDVHRAARVMAAGHGGQVLISQATRELLDADFQLADLGEHRLKDLSEPQRLFQLGTAEFPRLKTLNQTNLPVQSTALVGREAELEALASLLGDHRLVTLVGPGGSGKTRLALQIAADTADDFEDGVFWVSAQAITDPALVERSIAHAVGAQDGLARSLGNRRMLLVLDNLEQVLGCAPTVASLLAETPHVKVVATSREPLRVSGEQRFPVAPLPMDAAAALFLERAQAADPGFRPDPAVELICRRLDGLPLAVELAAARVTLLGPAELLARLDRALPLLTGGRRDAPERQRTLRGTIEWSYELLDPEEQRLFRGLAVFGASFDVDAALDICAADLDTLQSLVDKSLLRRWGSGRFGMLETISEYAREQLGASAEGRELAERHARYYLRVAESANLSADSLDQGQRHDVVLPEQDNLRRALDWCAETDPELGLRIAVALENFWMTDDPREGRQRVESMLARTQDLDPRLRAQALRTLGGCLYIAGDFEAGVRLVEEALAGFEAVGDEAAISHLLHRLAMEAIRVRNYEEAHRLEEESLAIGRRLGVRSGETLGLSTLAEVAWAEGDTEQALALKAESARLASEIGFTWWEAGALHDLAEWSLELGRFEEAERRALAALRVGAAIGDRMHQVFLLALLVRTALERGDGLRAGVLWGAVEREEERGAIGQWETYREEIRTSILEGADAAFEQGRARGRTLTLADAVAEALS
ncbi:MAG TPA: adenylate/guanylate cyclase domain-containing protein [Gaiellaceae bacterium]|nr:adenylate/guanylate cyclase domain-containing protein [Gaiellaceae bacterium]